MIPVKLCVQGLYSYQTLQEVEFRQLIGASVFGIFGKVGSGKSSLLEAISFALYGESERLNGRDNRAYNMMNLKSKHLIIDFEFQAGADQQLYKFVYEAKRHEKKHHEIASTERRSFQWEDGQWRPLGLEKDNVAALTKSILGLDYDNFKRTIIIPQNQFREFLELPPKDRTEMMSRMFRLEKYDLAGRVAKLEKINDAALNTIEGQLEGVGMATPEAIKQARQAVEAVELTIQEKEEEIIRFDSREQQLQRLQKRHQERADAGTALDKLKQEQPTFERIRAQIERYERCTQLFSVLFSQADGITTQQQQIADELQKSTVRLTITARQLPALEQAYQAALTAFENRDELQKQIDELDEVRFIQGIQYSIDQQTLTRDELQKSLDAQAVEIERLKAERTKHQTIVDQVGSRASQLEQLYAMQNWFTAYLPLKKAVDDLDRKIQAYDKALQDIKARKDKALVDFPDWEKLTSRQLPEAIQQALDAQQHIVNQRKAVYDDDVLRKKLHQYATALSDGKPCPLCGSTHHPTISHDVMIDDDVARSQAALRAAEQHSRDLNTLLGVAAGLLGEIKTVHGQGKTLVNEQAEAALQRTIHEDRFAWPGFTMDQDGEVNDAIRQENDTQRKLRTAGDAISSINRQLEGLEQKRAGTKGDVATLNGKLESLADTVAKQVDKLVYFQPAEIGRLNPECINDIVDKLTAQYEHTKDVFQQTEQEKSAAEGELTKYKTEVGTFTGQQTALQKEQDKLEAAIADALARHHFTRPDVDALLQTKLDVPTERERVQKYQQQLSTAQNQYNTLTTELAGTPFELNNLQNARQDLSRAQGEHKTLNQQLGENRVIHSDLVTQWERRQGIQNQFDALTLREKDLTTMKELFRAQGFVNHVSSVYLQNLCEAASSRFAKLTNNQLKLEVDDKNNFLVRDHLNGGKTRLAKTLSGGQLFQASLSLALALSDNIQHLTKSKQNLFFLDEGFGSLDKDSLQLVFKTLQALRNENRIVGIISHVEELQHEIETFICAEHSDTGSRIVRSWE